MKGMSDERHGRPVNGRELRSPRYFFHVTSIAVISLSEARSLGVWLLSTTHLPFLCIVFVRGYFFSRVLRCVQTPSNQSMAILDESSNAQLLIYRADGFSADASMSFDLRALYSVRAV